MGQSRREHATSQPATANGATNANGAASVRVSRRHAATSAPVARAFPSTIMDFELTLQHTLGRAAGLFANKQVVTNTAGGPQRTTYGALTQRVNQLGGVLKQLGVQPGDRVATLAWNTATHLECYFAIPCSGAVLHTLNLRLFPQDIAYIINDAQDSLIFVDADLLPILEKIADQLIPVRALIVMNGRAQPSSQAQLPPIYDYEELLAGQPTEFGWPRLDEQQAAAMCYTSGTTGSPKGVVYSHRSIMLHSLAGGLPDVLDISERDVIMPFVPMFHANAWGLAYEAPLFGASLVFPGRLMDPVSVTKLMAAERVTLAGGVPTIWIGMLQLLDKDPGAYDLTHLTRIICGGSAVTLALIEGLQQHNLTIIQAWGMTEMSPLGTISRVRSHLLGLPVEEQNKRRAKVGIAAPLVECRIVDDEGRQVPSDGTTFGELQVRGPWITGSYYHGGDDNRNKFADGWLRTGDVATIDADGYIGIVDRTKDMIKSGGEWISSVDLESQIMGHPQVLEATVIGVPHPTWQERPVAYVVPKPDFKDTLTRQDILSYLEPRVAKWWLPEEVIFIEAVPKTGVGKFDKKVLRALYASGHSTSQ